MTWAHGKDDGGEGGDYACVVVQAGGDDPSIVNNVRACPSPRNTTCFCHSFCCARDGCEDGGDGECVREWCMVVHGWVSRGQAHPPGGTGRCRRQPRQQRPCPSQKQVQLQEQRHPAHLGGCCLPPSTPGVAFDALSVLAVAPPATVWSLCHVAASLAV